MTEVERIVSRARRGRAVFVGLVALLCFGGIAWAIVVNFQQDTKITRVERSVCAKAPGGAECQRIRRQTDRKRTIADTCIAFWKVGYTCPAPSSGVKLPARGGDALQPASAGQPSTPAPAGDKGGGSPPKGGNDGPQAPSAGATPNAPLSPDRGEPPPSSAPVATSPPPSSPVPVDPPPSPATPEPEPPGLLTPALTTVCDVADRLAQLC